MAEFGRWLKWSQLPEIPMAPGVFQVKQWEGLIDYPRGKSAMLYYGQSERLGERIARFAAECANRQGAASWCVRFFETADPDATLAKLMQDFHRRFGSWPRLNHEMG